jgi:hypothetical protein
MPDCKTITISTCPPINIRSINYENCIGCVETFDAKCIIYKGSSLPNLGILNGDSLENILVKLEALMPNLINP